MILKIRSFVYSLVITLIVVNTATSSEERNILFNKDHYIAEEQELKAQIYDISKKICPNHTDEIRETINDYNRCSDEINEDQKSICEVIEENLRTCTKSLIRLYEKCLPEKTRKLPEFIIESSLSVTEYLCNTDGAHILELGNPCITKKEHHETHRCLKELRNIMKKYNHQNLPVRKELCEFEINFKSCFVSHVDNSCKDTTTREAYKGLYDAIFKPCK